MAKKRPTLTDLLNDLTFKVIYEKYKLIALNAYEWQGLPEGIKEIYIERNLYSKGVGLFIQDPDMSYMALEACVGVDLNVYGDPLKWNAIGFNYNKEFRVDECVVMENNKLRLNTDNFIYFYVNKLTEAERTMDVNVKAVKTPIIITCDDKDVLTFKRMFQQVDGNTPAIFADRNLNLDSIQALDTKAQFLCNDLMNYKKCVENELLTFLGINNTPTEKKERLITDEANSNNQLIDTFAELQLEARQRACEDINKMFGLNVSVRRRTREEVLEYVAQGNVRDNKTDSGTEGDS